MKTISFQAARKERYLRLKLREGQTTKIQSKYIREFNPDNGETGPWCAVRKGREKKKASSQN